MKTVTAWLVVYAILVIASSIFWMWYALSKSSLTAGNNYGNIKSATDPDKIMHHAELLSHEATGLTGGDTEGARHPAEST